jgi:hypothetical protein
LALALGQGRMGLLFFRSTVLAGGPCRAKSEYTASRRCLSLRDGMVVDSRMFHVDIAALLNFLNGDAPG